MGVPKLEFDESKLWCHSWWHRVRYGSRCVEEKIGDFDYVEFFCNKCGLKTDGYTHFKLPPITLPPRD